MAPVPVNSSVSEITLTKNLLPRHGSNVWNFEVFRQLVPLVARGGLTYLNASFMPPSNVIIHAAINEFNSEALLSPNPKPQWQQNTEKVRHLIARYINADPTSVAFMRDTTEGLGSFIRSIKFTPGDNVVILDSEHPNHAYGWMALRDAGLEVRQVPTIAESEKTGNVVEANAGTFAPYVDGRTRAIGLSSVMFHSGQKNDIKDICNVYRPKGIHVLVDMTQQVGFATVDVTDLNVSAAAFGFHKGLNCPTGLAALYVNPDVIKESDPTPPIVGYGSVSNVRADLLVPSDSIVFHPTARRYEHLNLGLINVAAAKAWLEFYLDVMGPENLECHLYSLGDSLRDGCQRLGIKVVGPESHKAHAPHLYILDLHEPKWAEHLRANHVYVTPYRLGIRVSFGYYNNSGDVEILVKVLQAGIDAGIPLQ
ncbi:unnamed protein product [Penicillium salamii]|uniref:Aminotransferase class V domain-containing protein n=1 Tax=Penicillium salamii TaxID=1612424 RepID=A0A9W4JKT9_9EURO|nr:unnamed protein product [Penicillium salamii]CAG7974460.1 unnamed protein product [Penicillium salamii]CAG8186748.1 unnamed protein product [Penicillium salamii]CAG8198862.1 unnamed protein product [Penicillium salamii]CAG8204521.1 unnamed protein product [Penicillium salamii]